MISWSELLAAIIGEEDEPIDDDQTQPNLPGPLPDEPNINSEGTPGTEDDMKIGTHNIRNFPNLPRASVRKAAREIASISDICGLQEIREQQDKEDLKTAMTGFKFVTLSERICQAYRAKKVKLSNKGPRGFVKTNDATKYYPMLGFSIATYESIRRPKLGPFIVIAVHFPPEAFKVGAVKDRALKRRDWNTNWEMLNDFCNRWQNRGYTVFVVGDFNNRNLPKLKVTHSRVLMHDSLDYIIVCPGSIGVKVKNRKTRHTPSDHRALAVNVRLRQKKNVTKP